MLVDAWIVQNWKHNFLQIKEVSLKKWEKYGPHFSQKWYSSLEREGEEGGEEDGLLLLEL